MTPEEFIATGLIVLIAFLLGVITGMIHEHLAWRRVLERPDTDDTDDTDDILDWGYTSWVN